MRKTAILLLLAAAFVARGDEADTPEIEREKARVAARLELKKEFSSAERIVADKIEAFALQPIRDWRGAREAVLAEPREMLADPLRYYLLDRDWEVKAFACDVAGRAGLVELLPELQRTYDEAEYPIVRRMAVHAAVRFAAKGAENAMPLLVKGRGDEEPGVRFLSVTGFEAIGDDGAKEELWKAAEDEDHDTRYRALGSLARLGDAKARKKLVDGFRSYVATKDLQRRASLVTHDVGERYSQFLNCLALGYGSGVEGMKLLETAILRRGDYDNKLFLTVGAAAALGKARPLEEEPRGIQERALRSALKDGDAVVRGLAAFAAGYTEDARYTPYLRSLLTDAHSDVRHNAVEALGRIPGKGAVELLAGVLRKERDVPVRLAAVRALAHHDEPEAVDALARALRDKRYMVRAAAATMLGRWGPEAKGAVDALARSARDRDYGVREAAVVALSRIGDPEGLPAILKALEDRDRGVRIHALRAITRFPRLEKAKEAQEANERIVEILVGTSDIEERRAARACLLRVRSPHAVPALIEELDARSYSKRSAALTVLRDYNRGRLLDYSPRGSAAERRKGVKRWEEWWEKGGTIAPAPPPPKRRADQDLPSFHRYARDLRWRGIDLVLAYDSTGSMLPVIRAVRQRLDILIEESSRIVPNLRLSLFTYRDEGEEYVYYGTPLTYATENLKAFVQVAEANRGGDLPEAITATVEAAVAKLRWRPEAQKVIVVIGDAPYHPENAARLFRVVKEFTKARGTVHALYTDPGRLAESITARRSRAKSAVTQPFLERLREMAQAGGGKAVSIEDTETLIREILVLSFGEKWRSELESRLAFD